MIGAVVAGGVSAVGAGCGAWVSITAVGCLVSSGTGVSTVGGRVSVPARGAIVVGYRVIAGDRVTPTSTGAKVVGDGGGSGTLVGYLVVSGDRVSVLDSGASVFVGSTHEPASSFLRSPDTIWD